MTIHSLTRGAIALVILASLAGRDARAADGEEFLALFADGPSADYHASVADSSPRPAVRCSAVLQRVGAADLDVGTYDLEVQFRTFWATNGLPAGTITECVTAGIRISICELKKGALISRGPVAMTSIGNWLTGWAFNPIVRGTKAFSDVDTSTPNASREYYLLHAAQETSGLRADHCSCNQHIIYAP